MSSLTRLVLALLLLGTHVSLLAAEPAEVSALRAKAEKGNALAQYNLGLAYAQGQLVPADLPEAFVWLSLASENGATGKALDSVLGNISDAQLTEGRRRLGEFRAVLAARAATSIANHPVRRPQNRGFSLTASKASPATAQGINPVSEAPVTKAPEAIVATEPTRPDEPAVDSLTEARNEISQLKAELARTQEQLRQHEATITQLQVKLANRMPLAASMAVADPMPASR